MVGFLGYVMRKEGDCLESEIMQGTVLGVRKQGTPRMRWIDNMEKRAEWVDKLTRETEDRRS